MATETLRIDVTVNNKTAIAGLKQTEAELGKVAAASLKTGMAVNKGSNQAANALTNLGRVAQDAPFGFIGIQNNLNPLLESFQRLKTESGSTSGALKALAGSLIGPAGLGLALSVGSGLILTFGDQLSKLLGITFGLTEEQKALNKSIDGFKKSAAEEIIQFKELTSVAANANIPLEQRKQAVKELQKDYPAYLGNLSQEDILSGKIGDAYDKVVTALKAKIALQSAEEKLIPIIKEQLDVAEKIAVANKKINALQGIGADELKAGAKFAAETGKLNPFVALQAEAIAAKAEIEELTPIYDELDNRIKSTFNTMQPFIQASNGLNLSLDTQKNKIKSIAEILKELDANLKGVKAQYDAGALDIGDERISRFNLLKKAIGDIGQQEGPKAASAIADLKSKIDAMFASTAKMKAVEIRTETTPIGPAFTPEGMAQKVPEGMAQRNELLKQLTQRQLDYANALKLTTMNEEAAAAMTNVAMSAFTSLGNAMLQGQDIGEALGNVFKKLIVDLTQMVARALIFKAIMAGLSGGTSEVISGGSGMASMFNGMAVGGGGGGFLNFFKGLLGFADGGIASGPKSGYPVMLHGTEAVLNPKQFKNLTSNMMNMGAMQSQGGSTNLSGEFVVRGNDLVYVLNKQGFTNNLLGR